jgi:hypothetical protein
MQFDTAYPEAARVTRLLEQTVEALVQRLIPPLKRGNPNEEWWQYAHPSSAHFQVLKAVRAVSAINAFAIMHQHNFTQEGGAILRIIDQSLDEIMYVIEAHQTGEPTKGQQRIVDTFFGESVPTAEEFADGLPNPTYTSRREIRASVARFLSPSDPSQYSKMSQSTDRILDGYVHGYYPQIMELYHGGKKQFQMRGTGSERHLESERNHYFYAISNALAVVACLAAENDMLEQAALLKERRTVYMRSAEFPRRRRGAW